MSTATLRRPIPTPSRDQAAAAVLFDIGEAVSGGNRRHRLAALCRAAAEVPADRWPEPVRRAVANVAANPMVPVAIVLLSGAAGAAEFGAAVRK